MEPTGPHTALEYRLNTLGARIAALKQSMQDATGPEMIEDVGAMSQLEARYKILEEKLPQFETAGPSLDQKIVAEIAAMVDDLTSAVDDIIARADAECNPDQSPKRPP
jgi:hypothetical protein